MPIKPRCNVFLSLAFSQSTGHRWFVYPKALNVLLLVVLASQMAAPQRRGRGFVTRSTDVVFAIEFSPDGKTLAIARGAAEPRERFGRIELWDTDTGSLLRIIQGFDGPVRSISFTPDGKTIISGSLEYHQEKLRQKVVSRYGEVSSEVKWWDVSTGDLRNKTEIPGDGSTFIEVDCSPDGKQIAVVQSRRQVSTAPMVPSFSSATSPQPRVDSFFFFNALITSDLRLLDAQSGQQKIKVNIKSPGNLAYSSDGRFVATTGSEEIRVYSVETGKEISKIKGFRGRPNALTFSPDSSTLAVVSTKFYREDAGRFIRLMGRSEVKIFDTKDWKPIGSLSDLGAIRCVAYEPSGRYLLFGGMLNDNEKEAIPAIKVWDLKTKSVARFPTGGETYVDAAKLLTTGRKGRLLAVATEESIKLIDTEDWQVKQTMDSSSVGDRVKRPVGRFILTVKTILEVAFNEDGDLVTAETDQGEIKQWDPRTGEIKFQLPGADDPSGVSASINSDSFAEVVDGELTLWSSRTRVRRTVEIPYKTSALATAFSGDGHLMAVVIPGQILLYDTRGDSLVKSLSLNGVVIEAIGISNGGQTIAFAVPTGNISLLTVSDGSVRQTLPGTDQVVDLRFSPDDQLLAAAAGRDVNIYDVRTGALVRKLEKHDGAVNAVAFSADGRLLASGSDDRTAIIWEIASGKSKHRLKGHDQTVRTVAFSPDGKLLASGSGNSSVVLWDVKKGELNRVLR